MSEKQAKCVNIGQGIVFLLLLDFKTIVQHFAICRTEILFEQQKMMLGAVNLGKSYQNTGQLLRQEKRISYSLLAFINNFNFNIHDKFYF